MRIACAHLLSLLVVSFVVTGLAAADAAPKLGQKVDDFSLHDYYGKSHSLSDYADRRVVIVYFTGTECPLAKLYAPRNGADQPGVRRPRRGHDRHQLQSPGFGHRNRRPTLTSTA